MVFQSSSVGLSGFKYWQYVTTADLAPCNKCSRGTHSHQYISVSLLRLHDASFLSAFHQLSLLEAVKNV